LNHEEIQRVNTLSTKLMGGEVQSLIGKEKPFEIKKTRSSELTAEAVDYSFNTACPNVCIRRFAHPNIAADRTKSSICNGVKPRPSRIDMSSRVAPGGVRDSRAAKSNTP
jgi:hypothetical protein